MCAGTWGTFKTALQSLTLSEKSIPVQMSQLPRPNFAFVVGTMFMGAWGTSKMTICALIVNSSPKVNVLWSDFAFVVGTMLTGAWGTSRICPISQF
ncbi:hypothetical protein R3P38DRAFT_139956 [Favolaschia claudopus]|uniref:Uncharacterized protein n=1 Tax=Favolaschia claudopus TaxID=2862362 RepID=A0AAV9ZUV1_9AGAR